MQRCVYDEQSAQEVAADLGITASALRTRIARARDRLRTLIDRPDAEKSGEQSVEKGGDPDDDKELFRAA